MQMPYTKNPNNPGENCNISTVICTSNVSWKLGKFKYLTNWHHVETEVRLNLGNAVVCVCVCLYVCSCMNARTCMCLSMIFIMWNWSLAMRVKVFESKC
jgi:hypothetical protein